MLILFQLIVFIIIAIVFISMLIAMVSFAPWVPSPKEYLLKILEMANIKPDERFYDLGCGDGRVVILAARNFGARATGIELAIPRYISAFFVCLVSKTPKANIVLGNLFNHNISDADIIYVYGMPHALEKRLSQKLVQECKSGTRVISFMFEIKGWVPTASITFPGNLHNQEIIARLYILP